MRELIIEPRGWPCTFADCPPGLFVHNDKLCVKTTNLGDDAYHCRTGEGWEWQMLPTVPQSRSEIIVQPCVTQWVYREDDT